MSTETKYSTGDKVMIPATIRSARIQNGAVTYEVDADTWDVKEETITVDESKTAMKTLLDALDAQSRAVIRW